MTKFVNFASLDLSGGADAFNKPVPGGNYLEPGIYDVTIKAIENREDGFKVIMVTDSGKEFADRVFLLNKAGGPSQKFGALLVAVTGSNEKAYDFACNLKDTPTAIGGLVGARVRVDWKRSTRGYTLVQEAGAIRAKDAGDGTTQPILDRLAENEFPTFTDAREAIDALNATLSDSEKIGPAYCRASMFLPLKDCVHGNLQTIQAALQATTNTRTVTSTSAVAEAFAGIN